MSWKNNWNRTVEGWVQRRRRFREVSAATIGKLAGVKALEVSRATVPEPVLATREEPADLTLQLPSRDRK